MNSALAAGYCWSSAISFHPHCVSCERSQGCRDVLRSKCHRLHPHSCWRVLMQESKPPPPHSKEFPPHEWIYCKTVVSEFVESCLLYMSIFIIPKNTTMSHLRLFFFSLLFSIYRATLSECNLQQTARHTKGIYHSDVAPTNDLFTL